MQNNDICEDLCNLRSKNSFKTSLINKIENILSHYLSAHIFKGYIFVVFEFYSRT